MIGPSGYGAVFGAAVLSLLYAVLPEPAYMKIYSMSVAGNTVTAERMVRRHTLADWRVSVVRNGVDGPSCQTTPGFSEHQGWSHYEPSPRQARTFSVDDWVGDAGCYERLEPGAYKMFVTWTPRDGSAPVVAVAEFEAL